MTADGFARPGRAGNVEIGDDAAACRYPGCSSPRAVAATGSGRRPAYCTEPTHNATTAFRLRQERRRSELQISEVPAPDGCLTEAGRHKRREILHLAAIEFSSRCYHGTTMRDLGLVTGLTQPMLYYYVGGKMEFLLAVYEELLDTHLAALSELEHVDPPAERLREFIRIQLELAEKHHPEVVVYFRERRTLDDVARKRVRPRQDRLEEVLRHIISDGISRGEFATGSLDAVEMAIWGMLNWSTTWLDPAKERTAAEHATHFSNLILNGLTTTRLT